MEWQRLVCPSLPQFSWHLSASQSAALSLSGIRLLFKPRLKNVSFFCFCLCRAQWRLIEFMWKSTPVIPRQCCLSSWLCVSFVRDAIPSCNSEEFVKEASEVPNFLEEVGKCREICSAGAAELSGQLWNPDIQHIQSIIQSTLHLIWSVGMFSAAGSGDKYPQVVFLGTGSALPMKIRNVSGTLVNIRYGSQGGHSTLMPVQSTGRQVETGRQEKLLLWYLSLNELELIMCSFTHRLSKNLWSLYFPNSEEGTNKLLCFLLLLMT